MWKFENLFVNFVFGEIIVLGCVDYDGNQQLPPVLPWGLSDCIFCVFLYFPILYFLLYKLGLSTVCLETIWRASVTCLYFWACFCICLCVFHRACILYFYISYFTFLTKQAEYGKIRISRSRARHSPSLAFEDLYLYLYLCCLYFFISVFFYFIFHIEYGVIGSSRPSARHLPGLWGFEASTRGAGAAAGQMPATPLLSISPLPSFVMSPSIQPYEGDFVLCLPTGNIDVFFLQMPALALNISPLRSPKLLFCVLTILLFELSNVHINASDSPILLFELSNVHINASDSPRVLMTRDYSKFSWQTLKGLCNCYVQ